MRCIVNVSTAETMKASVKRKDLFLQEDFLCVYARVEKQRKQDREMAGEVVYQEKRSANNGRLAGW